MGWLKYSALAVFTILSILFAIAYPYYSRQALYLTLKRNAVVEVNGVIVPGEILGGRHLLLLTRRDAGKEHSYFLVLEGDIDSEGDMGAAIDCHSWVAPRLPILVVVTQNYPECTGTPSITPGRCRRVSVKAMHGLPYAFETPEHDIIGIRTNRL